MLVVFRPPTMHHVANDSQTELLRNIADRHRLTYEFEVRVRRGRQTKVHILRVAAASETEYDGRRTRCPGRSATGLRFRAVASCTRTALAFVAAGFAATTVYGEPPIQSVTVKPQCFRPDSAMRNDPSANRFANETYTHADVGRCFSHVQPLLRLAFHL